MRPSENFTRRLREARTRRGWTQAELAKRVTALGHSLDKTAVTKLEGGNRKVTLDDAVALAAALDVPVLSLLLPAEGDAALTRKLAIPFPFARAWMSGQLPLSREGVDSYRQAARRLPLGVSNADFNSLINTPGDKKRKREMLLALIERERRDLAELERIAEMRPELAAALENIRESIAYKEKEMK
jgi:transcriptional regulator with XRE-family HTH domain